MNRTLQWMILVIASMLAAPVGAETVYKITAPDGSVTYSDAAPQGETGGATVETEEIDPNVNLSDAPEIETPEEESSDTQEDAQADEAQEAVQEEPVPIAPLSPQWVIEEKTDAGEIVRRPIGSNAEPGRDNPEARPASGAKRQ